MKTITPNRGMIVLIKTYPGIAPYDFITCNSENTLNFWKLHVHTQEKQISLQTIEDMQLDDRPDHIALLSDTIAIAIRNKLLFYRLFKTKTSLSWKIFQCSKDERHSSTITYVSDYLFSIDLACNSNERRKTSYKPTSYTSRFYQGNKQTSN